MPPPQYFHKLYTKSNSTSAHRKKSLIAQKSRLQNMAVKIKEPLKEWLEQYIIDMLHLSQQLHCRFMI